MPLIACSVILLSYLVAAGFCHYAARLPIPPLQVYHIVEFQPSLAHSFHIILRSDIIVSPELFHSLSGCQALNSASVFIYRDEMTPPALVISLQRPSINGSVYHHRPYNRCLLAIILHHCSVCRRFRLLPSDCFLPSACSSSWRRNSS